MRVYRPILSALRPAGDRGLLGVPEEDHRQFVHHLASQHPGAMDAESGEYQMANPLEWLDAYFSDYVEDRRREPKGDV